MGCRLLREFRARKSPDGGTRARGLACSCPGLGQLVTTITSRAHDPWDSAGAGLTLSWWPKPGPSVPWTEDHV